MKAIVRLPWKLFQGASVEHLNGNVWILTVDRPGQRPEFCVQNGLGEPIPPACNQCTSEELKAMAEYQESMRKKMENIEKIAQKTKGKAVIEYCGIHRVKEPDDIISGHIEYETQTLCGEPTCSDECWQSWIFCPYCGKPFRVPKQAKPLVISLPKRE